MVETKTTKQIYTGYLTNIEKAYDKWVRLSDFTKIEPEHNRRIFDMQVKIEKVWNKSWDKSIQELIDITNRTHISDGMKVKAIRMGLKSRLS